LTIRLLLPPVPWSKNPPKDHSPNNSPQYSPFRSRNISVLRNKFILRRILLLLLLRRRPIPLILTILPFTLPSPRRPWTRRVRLQMLPRQIGTFPWWGRVSMGPCRCDDGVFLGWGFDFDGLGVTVEGWDDGDVRDFNGGLFGGDVLWEIDVV